MDIRHILGKVNPADTITRQIKAEDEMYSGQVKQVDQTLVDSIRIPSDASDMQLQDKLNQLYNTAELKTKQDQALKQVMSTPTTEQASILAVYEHQVQLDDQFKIQLFNAVSNDDQFADIIQKLQDPEQLNEISVNKQTYRIKSGTLKVHEEGQDQMANYWRIVVPSDINLK